MAAHSNTMVAMTIPVSIVIPLFNSERHIIDVLNALLRQDYAGEKEIIVVNDGSTDRSRELLKPYEAEGSIRVIDQRNQGAVAATNAGFQKAKHAIVCSVDSDVVLHPDFLTKIMGEFEDPSVGAVQGYYRTPEGISFWARMMGYDVEKRYDDIPGKKVTQVCTGDTAYRRAALDKTGLFDPAFVYGYDNDMSYRLQAAGYSLIFRRDAVCDHYWKADLVSFIKQQYRSAYGRMQLIRKHRDRASGDSVSGLRMILQVPATLLIVALLLAGALSNALGYSAAPASAGLLLLVLLLIDRFLFTLPIVRKQLDVRALFLPFVHLLRNIVWIWALTVWTLKGARSKT